MSDRFTNEIVTAAAAATVGSLTAMIVSNHFNNNKGSVIKSRFRRCQEMCNSLLNRKVATEQDIIILEKMGCSDKQLVDYLNKNL